MDIYWTSKSLHFGIEMTVKLNKPCMTKRTRKSMQVDASLQNQNLRTHLQWVAKRIHKSARNFTQVLESLKISRIYSWLTINLCRPALGGQTVKNSRRLAYEFELDQSQRRWVTKRNTSWTQVEKLCRLASPFGQCLPPTFLKWN